MLPSKNIQLCKLTNLKRGEYLNPYSTAQIWAYEHVILHILLYTFIPGIWLVQRTDTILPSCLLCMLSCRIHPYFFLFMNIYHFAGWAALLSEGFGQDLKLVQNFFPFSCQGCIILPHLPKAREPKLTQSNNTSKFNQYIRNYLFSMLCIQCDLLSM